jgi:ribonucleotide reductase alpha subunit
MRLSGLIPDPMLTFDNSIRTIDQYYSYDDLAKQKECDSSASSFLKKYEVGHEWAFEPGDHPLEVQRAAMKESLTYSPLAIALYAWQMDQNRVYFRPDGAPDVHWCVIYGYYENSDWKCWDSYDSTTKRLHRDFGFTFVKRYHIEKLTAEISKPKKNIIEKIFDFFLNLYLIIRG